MPRSPIAISNTDRYTSAFTLFTSPVSDADTLALWTFDEGSGGTVYDLVGGIDRKMDGATHEAVGPGCP